MHPQFFVLFSHQRHDGTCHAEPRNGAKFVVITSGKRGDRVLRTRHPDQGIKLPEKFANWPPRYIVHEWGRYPNVRTTRTREQKVIIRIEWVEDSIKNGKWMPLKDYEVM